MTSLWVALTGIALYLGSGFMPWVVEGMFEKPVVMNMWMTLAAGFGSNVWNTLLWLTPLATVVILILALVQLFKRSKGKKNLDITIFILALAAMVPLPLRTISYSLIPITYHTTEFMVGFYVSWVALIVIALGCSLRLSKTR
ncbi:hypothetical protein JXM67_02465 [candidate division WOR-3 bacterium]|nr:hypothetical protein [candidate division WOR-3 bacterium]